MSGSRKVTCGAIAVAGLLIWTSPWAVEADGEIEVSPAPMYDVVLNPEAMPPALRVRAQRVDVRSVESQPAFGPRSGLRSGSRLEPNVELQSGAEEIELQDFEEVTFPPEGWTTWDRENQSGGPGETYTWGIQDCDIPADSLGLKAAWSVGGGRLGAELLCGGNYDQPARSWLLRTGINTEDYPGGIQVNIRFKVDIPRDEAFEVCGSTEIPTTIACSHAVSPTPGRWLTFRDPIVFARAAGLTDAAVIFRYEDAEPDGGNIGAYIDDILIEGLLEVAPPTATSTSETVLTVTPTASRPAPTVPVPTGPRIFLPLASKNADLRPDPGTAPTPSPGRVAVEFAADFLEDGTAITPGPRFAYGIVQLCSKQSWFDVPVGQAIRRQWSELVGSEYLPLGGPDLNSVLNAPSSNGFSEQCVEWKDRSGDTVVPVPVGRYRVELFFGDSSSAAASGVAEVYAADPATPVPTLIPSPTPTGAPPTPEPGDCFNPIENGDFEAGPGVGWLENTSASGGLIRGELPYAGSRFSALFGSVLGVQEVLQSRRAIPGRDESAVEAATLRFVLLMITDETPGAGEETDIFGVCFGGNTPSDVECVARATEDTWPEGTWIAVEQDVTDYVVLRDGFTNSTPLFIGQSNATLTTNFAIDNVELDVCLAGGERMIVPIDMAMSANAPTVPYSVGRALAAPLPVLRQAGGGIGPGAGAESGAAAALPETDVPASLLRLLFDSFAGLDAR